MGASLATRTSSGACFDFVRGSALREERDVARFRQQLRLAVRVAQGLSVAVRLEWRTGPSGGIRLTARGSAARHWAGMTLGGCYPPGHWRPALPPPTVERSLVQRHGSLTPGGGLPELAPEDTPGWTEVVFQTLPTFPRGARVIWEATPGRPVAPVGPTSPGLESTAVPTGYRLAPLPDSERALRDLLHRRRWASWALRVHVEAPISEESTLRGLCELVRSSSQSLEGAPLEWSRPVPWLRPAPRAFRVSETELAALFPEPWSRAGGDAPISGLTQGIPVGYSSQGEIVRLPVLASEGRHACLLGETGMGKSTTLIALALAAARRSGVVLFDPIGDTARTFLQLLPPALEPRVLWISPVESPVSLNALETLRAPGAGPLGRDRARLDLVGALRRVRSFRYAETPFWGPRIEEVLGRAIGAAAEIPGATLVQAAALLDGREGQAALGLPPAAADAVRDLRSVARARP
ncbi:MAG TPA: DUF87 domain-containing protein, partial [Thermoplasmata archaeon]|nr:DUF87 domain-containing protein [Thermoplasmata archaeon]